MLEKFNGIFYLIIYLVHFIGVGVYAFQTIFGTKSFMERFGICLLYTSPSPRDKRQSRMPSSA